MRYLLLIILLFDSHVLAEEAKPCRYMSVSGPELIEYDSCISFKKWYKNANQSDGVISKKVAMSARYDENNLSYLYSEYGVFYFTKSGKLRRTMIYDNGPDYFESGLARTKWNGKIGFFNKSLDIVIAPQFDFAFPFLKSATLVCNGCVKVTVGEHSTMGNAMWGVIDLSGNIVIPIRHTRVEAINAFNKQKSISGN